MTKYYLLILFYTFLSSLAAFFLKKISNNKNLSIKSILLDINIYIGGFLYFVSAILTIIALMELPYNIVYSLSALTYVWSIIVAKMFFDEKLSMNKVLSILLIILGVCLVGEFKIN